MVWLRTTTPRRHRAPKAHMTSRRQRAQAARLARPVDCWAVPLGPRARPWPWPRGKWNDPRRPCLRRLGGACS